MPFIDGLEGAGAIAGQWTDMHADPVDPEPGGDTIFCEDVEDQIGGPGGIWLQQEDVVAPAAPQLSATDPGSPALDPTPRILGSAEQRSTVRLYSGAGCSGDPLVVAGAAELASPGLSVNVAEGTTAVFSATATDLAGNASACSASISYTRLHVDPRVDVPVVPPPPARACVVPNVVGKKLARAKRAIRAAGCRVAKVKRPAPGHKRHRPLVVKSTNPGAGAEPASGKVTLKLGPAPHRR